MSFTSKFLEPIAWCALALAAAISQLPPGSPRLSDDSFQYLSAASHLRSTYSMSTSLVHFDTERSHGTIPAPLTWFPPGYPLAIAAISTIGFSYEMAGFWISIASFVLVTGGLWHLVRLLDTSRWTARAVVLCWLTNSLVMVSAFSVLSEPLFTAFGLASLLFLVHTNEPGTGLQHGLRWIGAAVMAGLSYWVRYAGFLWVCAFLTILLLRMTVKGSRQKPSRPSALVAAALLLLFLAPLMVRNIALVGDWRGGNNTPVAMSISRIVTATPGLSLRLLLGGARLSQLWLPIALVTLGFLWGCVMWWRRAKAPGRRASLREALSRFSPETNAGVVLAVFSIYAAGIAAIATRSVISYDRRMFIPVLPHLLALMACGAAFLMRRLSVAGSRSVPAIVFCLLLGYVIANHLSLASLGPTPHQITEEILLRPDEAGRSIEQLLNWTLKSGAVIAATNGQATGYALNRPTLSLVGPPYSHVEWDAHTLRMELTRFRATRLLVFRDPRLDPLVESSRFLGALAVGQSPPWLRPAGFNRDLYVYSVQPGAPDETLTPDSTSRAMVPANTTVPASARRSAR